MVLFTYNLEVYNSAGETVRKITLSGTSTVDPGKDFAVGPKVFAPKNGQVALITAGGKTFSWAGDNDGGQFLQNGTYYVKLDLTDQFGHSTAMTVAVTLLSSDTTYALRVFNSAGEEVKEIMLSGYNSNAPSRLDADKSSIVIGQGSGGAGQVIFDLGNGTTASWDGTGSDGQRVQSGSYLAQLIVSHDSGPKSVASAAIIVLNTGDSLLGGAVLAPNPLNLAGGHAGSQAGSAAILKLNAGAGVEVTGRLYNMAGELVMTATNDMNPSEMRFEMAGRQMSSGVYILAVTAKAPWGSSERRSFKLVIVR